MESGDEYELMPHKEIIELRKEVEKLKKNPLGQGKTADNLLDAVNSLNESINSLMGIFEKAADTLRHGHAPEEKHEHHDGSLSRGINKLIEQNKEIAEGILSIADMVKREKRDIRSLGTMRLLLSRLPSAFRSDTQTNR
jgi:hypothetical protein